MRTISADKHTRDFSPFHPPAYRVSPGEWLRVECLRSDGGSIQRPAVVMENDELRAAVGWVRGMPMTGPIYVEGAEPGDALAVVIDEIECDARGWTDVQIGRGPAGALIGAAEVRFFTIENGWVDFGFGLRLPIAPMIGAIGTAPCDHAVDAGAPFTHGGNMDCTLIGPNSTLYLPVNVPGALVGLGDLHAAMGDGEVGTGGLEVGGAVTLRLELVKEPTLPLPLVDTGDIVSVISSAEDLEEASCEAVQAMVRWLARSTALGVNDAAMLISLVGDLRICQVVDPLMTCRMDIPKSVVTALGLALLDA